MKQEHLPFGKGRGGKRKGAGRKPKGELAGVPHRPRAPFSGREPVHVTIRLVDGLPSLRRARPHEVIRDAIAQGGDRFGFRLRVGWKRHGLISLYAIPGKASP